MASSKFHFAILLIVISLIVNVQSIRVMDDSSDCEFKGSCQTKADCYERCGVGKPPFKIALCEPYGLSGRVCCCV
ncbi:putative defensin-like protein [Cardamine amara subsp. amara]|uniref:Defensin-like protein n=1 Tax=Cardamine amara subsp. amara TaxID=228776 RepID=A0ABD1AUW1_CARAN